MKKDWEKRKRKADHLSVTEEMQLWDMGIPGNTNPSSLNFAAFFVCSQHFGTRGCQEHHQLRVENLKFVKSADGTGGLTKQNR